MKLLNYTSIRYLLFAALLLLISVPVFYVVLDKIFINAIDKDLNLYAGKTPARINQIKSESDLALWKALDNDIEIVDARNVSFHTKPFTEKKWVQEKNKKVNFRILQKQVNILGKNYVIQIESSMLEKEDLIKTILFIQLGLLFFLLLGAAGINYFINKNVWKPFYGSLAFLQRFKIDSLTEESLEVPKILEFRQLNQSIQQLTTSVRKAYFSQKEFTENASHELQTPLTNLKFKLELLLQEKNLSQSQSLLISDMYKVIEQLDELNKNLLLLSKIENGQFTSSESVDIIEVINEVSDDLLLIAESKSQKITQAFSLEQIYLQSNKMLLKILVKNLLLNALQYSDANESIHISADKNSIKISNKGNPLEVPADKLFGRFNKNNSRKGNGLGLSIVKTICNLYGYQISYEYVSGCHNFIVLWHT